MDTPLLEAAGWKRIETKGTGFNNILESLWERGSGDEREFGFVPQTLHANGHMGTVHGGVLLTFADICLGTTVARALGAARCVTLQLQGQFVAAAAVGDFLTCRPEIVRQSSQLFFMRGLVTAGTRTVLGVDGIWKVLEKRIE